MQMSWRRVALILSVFPIGTVYLQLQEDVVAVEAEEETTVTRENNVDHLAQANPVDSKIWAAKCASLAEWDIRKCGGWAPR